MISQVIHAARTILKNVKRSVTDQSVLSSLAGLGSLPDAQVRAHADEEALKAGEKRHNPIKWRVLLESHHVVTDEQRNCRESEVHHLLDTRGPASAAEQVNKDRNNKTGDDGPELDSVYSSHALS